MKWFTNALILTLNLIAAGILIAINYVSVLPPSSVWSVFAFTNIFFSGFAILNLLFIVWWIIRLRWFAVFSLIAIGLSFHNIAHTYVFFAPESNTEINTEGYTIESDNLHHFLFFPDETGTKTGNSILDHIAQSDADVICLQEFSYSDYSPFTLKDIKKALAHYPYSHIEFVYKDRYISKGIATFSKYKIKQKQRIHIPAKHHAAIATDILIGDSVVRVINCHLESNRLTDKDKKLTGISQPEDIKSVIKTIQSKLYIGSRKRGEQALNIVSFVTNSTLPTIVCGDLNDIPTSYTYQLFSKHLTDVFTLFGKGFGNTFHEKLYQFRIDYFFVNNGIKPIQMEVNAFDKSDHYPLRMRFKMQ